MCAHFSPVERIYLLQRPIVNGHSLDIGVAPALTILMVMITFHEVSDLCNVMYFCIVCLYH